MCVYMCVSVIKVRVCMHRHQSHTASSSPTPSYVNLNPPQNNTKQNLSTPPKKKRAESYTELLSRCYGLAGVCDMYGGDWEDAYDRLQKAARCVIWYIPIGRFHPTQIDTCVMDSCIGPTPTRNQNTRTYIYTHSMAGAPTWQCRSASTLGAFHLYTGKEGGPKEAVAVWEETLQVHTYLCLICVYVHTCVCTKDACMYQKNTNAQSFHA